MGLINIIKNFLAKFKRKAPTEKIVEPLKTDRDILFENSTIKSKEKEHNTIVDDNSIKKLYKKEVVLVDDKVDEKYEVANINYSKRDDLSKWQEHLEAQLAHLKSVEEQLKDSKNIDNSIDKKSKDLQEELLENTRKNLSSISTFINNINLVARYKNKAANDAILKENYIIDINKKLANIDKNININVVEAKVEYSRIFEIVNTPNPKLKRIYKDAIQEHKVRWNNTLSAISQRITQRENEIAQEAYKNIIIGRFEALEKVIPTDISIAHNLYRALFNTIEESTDILNSNEKIVFDKYKNSWSKRLKQAKEKIEKREAEIAKEIYENEIQKLFNSLEKALSKEDILEVRSIGPALEEKLKPEYKAWKKQLAKLIEKGKALDKTLLKKTEEKIKEETYALEQILALNKTSEITAIQQRIDNGIKEIKNTYPQLEARFNEVKSKLQYLIALKAEEDKQAYIAKIDGLFTNLNQAIYSEHVYNIRSYIQSIKNSIHVDYNNWNSKLSDAQSKLAAIDEKINLENKLSELENYINNNNIYYANSIINNINNRTLENYYHLQIRFNEAKNRLRYLERQEEERKEREREEAARLERIRREREEEERRERARREREEEERAARQRLGNQSLKSNWTEFRDVLKANGISRFYHFTARENIEKIRNSGGLYSWYYLENNGKTIPVPGGGDLSRNLDRRHGLQDYVRLSFTSDHPMAFRLKESGHNIVVLQIDIDVAYFEETRFSNMNAAANNHQQGKSLSDLKRVNFAATQERYVKRENPIFPYTQAEVMVKTHIPLKYIKNIHNL